MPKIFVSYRRQDSAAHAGRLCDELVRAFGRSSIFMDIDSIEPGDEFADVLSERLRRTDVFLALIGPGWLDACDEDGQRRLDSPGDFVRVEVSSALKQRILTIPVLLGGAAVPDAARLPENLKRLPDLHAFVVSDLRFRRDAKDLIKAIDGRLGTMTRVRLVLFRHRLALATACMLFGLLYASLGSTDWLRTPQLSGRLPSEEARRSWQPSTVSPPEISSERVNADAGSGMLGRSSATIDVATMKLKRQIDKTAQVQELLKDSNRPLGTLGVVLAETPENQSVYITSLIESGPAYDAGLRAGDVIETLNSRPMKELHETEFSILTTAPGSTMMVSVRRGQRQLAFPVQVGRMGDLDIQELRAQIEDRAAVLDRQSAREQRDRARPVAR